jgi:hypothetical protein
MDVTEYEKVTLNDFKGLYKRGIDDNCPPDHSTVCTNVIHKRGQFMTRYGSRISKPYTWPIKRIFVSTINANLVPVTLDTNGIIRYDSTVILNDARIIDFVGLNMFDKTFILPIIASGPTSGLKMLVLFDNAGTIAWRNVGGIPPEAPATMGLLEVAGGNISIGAHYFAVSYITSTGFTTPPGPFVPNFSTGAFTPALLTATGSKKVNIFQIPTGPVGTVARQLFVTQADLLTYYYLPGGLINDNTTTTLSNIDFFDTDLVISADSLFDNRTDVPAAIAWGGLDKYHGRMVVLGTANDLVLMSNSGDAESFSTLTGYIQIPSENDGNTVSSTFQINDNLYFTKPIGIFVTPDNGDNPSTWTIIPIDGGVGSIGYGTSSITAHQAHLTTAETVLISDLDGLFLFNGIVIRPPLTYKIENIWKQYVTVNTLKQISVFVDPFHEEIYVQLPGYPTILVCNYGDGLDPMAVRWSTLDFNHTITTITMSTLPDDEFIYCLRFVMGGTNGIYKYHEGITGDTIAGSTFPIATVWDSAMIPINVGGINVFRGIRLRGFSKNPGGGYINPSVATEDGNFVNLPSWLTTYKPGQDYFRQLNQMSEKLTVQIANTDQYGIIVQRIDLFGKLLFPARPQ